MSRLINEPVQFYRSNTPTKMSFIWRKCLYRVEDILACWREPSEWWNGQPIRLYIRVNARNSSVGTYELCKLGENWFLSRVLD